MGPGEQTARRDTVAVDDVTTPVVEYSVVSAVVVVVAVSVDVASKVDSSVVVVPTDTATVTGTAVEVVTDVAVTSTVMVVTGAWIDRRLQALEMAEESKPLTKAGRFCPWGAPGTASMVFRERLRPLTPRL